MLNPEFKHQPSTTIPWQIFTRIQTVQLIEFGHPHPDCRYKIGLFLIVFDGKKGGYAVKVWDLADVLYENEGFETIFFHHGALSAFKHYQEVRGVHI